MKSCYFTLIELLVVIVIITILAALLLPMLGKARDTAILTQCMSNSKQIGVAFQFYHNDYADYFPNYIDPCEWNYLLSTGRKFSLGYVTRKSMHCPASTYSSDPLSLGYGYNYYVLAYIAPQHKLRNCKFPAEQLVTVDSDKYIVYSYGLSTYMPLARHNGKTALNIQYADGHAAKFKILNYNDPYGTPDNVNPWPGYLGYSSKYASVSITVWCKFDSKY